MSTAAAGAPPKVAGFPVSVGEPGVVLPPSFVTETVAILAKKRKGKTYGAKVIAERLVRAGGHAVVLDPLGVWWGLRAGADGSPEGGLPLVIIGGEHADVPLDVSAGAAVADLVVSERLSVILDLSGHDPEEWAPFVTAFLKRLFAVNRAPIHLFVDEADEFAPQQPAKWQQEMLRAMVRVVRRAGFKGVGMTLISQRAASVNKEVLTQIGILFALGTSSPNDLAAIDEWMGQHASPEQRSALRASLPTLEKGEAWLWGVGDDLVRFRFGRLTTLDTSATPAFGEEVVQPRALADVDTAALAARFSAALERAADEDPARLKARLAEVERELQETKRQNAIGAAGGAAPDAAASPTSAPKGRGKAAQQLTLPATAAAPQIEIREVVRVRVVERPFVVPYPVEVVSADTLRELREFRGAIAAVVAADKCVGAALGHLEALAGADLAAEPGAEPGDDSIAFYPPPGPGTATGEGVPHAAPDAAPDAAASPTSAPSPSVPAEALSSLTEGAQQLLWAVSAYAGRPVWLDTALRLSGLSARRGGDGRYSGGVRRNLSLLRQTGWIELFASEAVATPAGMAALGLAPDPDPAAAVERVLLEWERHLGGPDAPAVLLLRHLAGLWLAEGSAVATRLQAASALGLKVDGAQFREAVQALQAEGDELIEAAGGKLCVSERLVGMRKMAATG